jgi:hypothetical protein
MDIFNLLSVSFFIAILIGSWLITEFVTRLTRRVPLVEQELLTLPEHLSSPPVFSGVRVTRSLVLCVCFVDRDLFLCILSCGHCVVCSSVFWPLCCLFFCLFVIVLSVPLSFGHCVVCSSIFWPLCCLFFFDIRILTTPLISSNSSNRKFKYNGWLKLTQSMYMYMFK